MPDNSHTQPLNARAPLVFDTRDLPRRPGAMRTLTRTIPAPTDLGLELISVPQGADLQLDLRLESVTEGVLVTVTATAPVEGECGRCLRAIRDSLSVTFQELYAYADSTTDETTEEDEVGRLQGDLLDLEPELRDAVVLALPATPLCRTECPGLCAECGEPWDDLPADHSHQQVDPRWAALSNLAARGNLETQGNPAEQGSTAPQNRLTTTEE